MNYHPLFLSLALTIGSTAHAEADPRVRTVLFTPDKVVRFTGKPGYQSSIRFGADERIENVAVGDSAAWQVTPNKRGTYLFIKPLIAGARSNLMVVTDKRTYLFDLESLKAAQPIYALSFDYPQYPQPGSIQPAPEPVVQSAPVALAASPPEPLALSFGWKAAGAKSLRPARMFNDARAVYLSWPTSSTLPAVLLPAPDGTESPVAYRMVNGYIVVEGRPTRIIIRRGREQATITAPRETMAVAIAANPESRRERR
jgi:type IV secretion system protein VirB9